MSNVSPLPYSVELQFFGQRPVTIGPKYVSITQEEFAHDTAVMQFWADDANSSAYVSGTPMALTFGRTAAKRMFYGYVNHVSRTNNSTSKARTLTDRNSVTVTCVGASYWMKQPGTVAWYNQTASQIIAQIATRYNLGANIVPHSTVWPVLQMAGCTYWQFCVELAKRIGYTFYCNGTQLIFKPRQTNTSAIPSAIGFYDYKADPAGFPVFTPTLGATSPAGGQLANRQLAGINPRTNTITYSQVSGSTDTSILGLSQETPVFNHTEHFTSNSQEENLARVSGAGNLNQLYLTASATLPGNPMLCQGSLISVANANGSQNGLWYIEKAHHTLDLNTYLLELELGRDSLGPTQVINGITATSTVSPTVLQGNRWISSIPSSAVEVGNDVREIPVYAVGRGNLQVSVDTLGAGNGGGG